MKEILMGSLLSAFATGFGAIPILLFKNMTHRWRDILLAFAAGIMLSASMFSLIPEAIRSSNIYVVALGLLVGTYLLSYFEKNVPHIDIQNGNEVIRLEKKTMLIVTAITLHNIPEGLSVGVSFASDNESLGVLIALSIGLQNMPEGFLVGLFLVTQNINKWKAIGIATLTGAVEIVTAMLGYGLAQYFDGLVSYGLSFAAGAMLFIVYKELIPESHGDGHARTSTYAFMVGILVMLYITELFR